MRVLLEIPNILRISILSVFISVFYIFVGSIIYEIGIKAFRNYMLNSKDGIGFFLKSHLGVWMLPSMKATTNEDTLKIIFSMFAAILSIAIFFMLSSMESNFISLNLKFIKELIKKKRSDQSN